MANRVNSFNVQGNQYSVEADLTFDNSPTIGSSNPVTSNGIAEAIQGVTLGDSISYGRTDGTPIGYCSISYGMNNSAIADYSVSIGNNNINACKYGIAVGTNNKTTGYNSSVLLGSGNSGNGYSLVAIGLDGTIGSRINTNIGEEPSYNAKVFIGYINISAKKIYYDPDMENQITVSISTNEACYFVDKTEGQPNRAPGDVYLYKRTASYTYTLDKLAPQFVRLTNRASSALYIYRGLTYYDAANDKNYFHYDPSTQTFSDDVTDVNRYARPRSGNIYFDGISGNFLLYLNDGETNIIGQAYGVINWLKVKVYMAAAYGSGIYIRNSISKSTVLNSLKGSYGYIYTSNEDSSKKYKVFSRSDYGDDCDITNTLIDGQAVIDLSNRESGKGCFYYICDINGNARVARNPGASYEEGGASWGRGDIVTGQASIVLGSGSHTTGGGYGNIVCGTGCEVFGYAEGLAVFGLSNTVDVGPTFSGQCGSLIAGRSVSVVSHSISSHTFFGFGHSCNITCDAYGGSDRHYVMGSNINDTVYEGSYDNFIFGNSITVTNAGETAIFGHNNTISDLLYLYNYGYGNRLSGVPCVILTMDKSGIWTGTGVTYDASTGTYSFPQNKIFLLRGIPEEWDRGSAYYDRTDIGFMGYAKSTDGTTLTMIETPRSISYYTTVIGVMNEYQLDSEVSPTSTFSYTGYSTIIGSFNNVNWRDDYYGITVVGSGLDVTGEITKQSSFLGSYNTMTGTTGAKFVVGVGADSSNRKNGLAIFGSGVVAAPSSPDTINAGISAMAPTGLNSDKMVVTYGMMKDYTGPGGGGSSRPTVASVTLVESDWDGATFEQTVSLTGMTAGAIVIIQPIGSPQQFNYHNVYLESQSDDELTFKCTTTPSADISVKVVYWA